MKKVGKNIIIIALVIIVLTSNVMAAPAPGIYMGGSVLKYYSISEFMSANNIVKAQEMTKAGLVNVKYVHSDGRIVSTNILASGTPLLTALKAYVSGDLNYSYTRVDGSTVTPELGSGEDLIVISID